MGRKRTVAFSANAVNLFFHILTRCNLKCRHCYINPAQHGTATLPRETIERWLGVFADLGKPANLVLLGGEPTLHPDFAAIVEMLREYRSRHNPAMRIVVCTNGSGPAVRRRLGRLPADVAIKNTWKGARQRLFRPFNAAPVDLARYRWADYACGCRILEDCGLGLTPQGYYPCAVAGAIDRVFGFGRGRTHLPAMGEEMTEDLERFCCLCGHFGFAWPTRRIRMSPVWAEAYEGYRRRVRTGKSPG